MGGRLKQSANLRTKDDRVMWGTDGKDAFDGTSRQATIWTRGRITDVVALEDGGFTHELVVGFAV
jgi:hypothetical protein